jgi:hypothetical protein
LSVEKTREGKQNRKRKRNTWHFSKAGPNRLRRYTEWNSKRRRQMLSKKTLKKLQLWGKSVKSQKILLLRLPRKKKRLYQLRGLLS